MEDLGNFGPNTGATLLAAGKILSQINNIRMSVATAACTG